MRRLILLRVHDEQPADLITIQEAARILGVSRSSVYNAINAGRITVYVREWDLRQMVRRSDVERLGRFRPKPPEED